MASVKLNPASRMHIRLAGGAVVVRVLVPLLLAGNPDLFAVHALASLPFVHHVLVALEHLVERVHELSGADGTRGRISGGVKRVHRAALFRG